MNTSATINIPVIKVSGRQTAVTTDLLAVEEPLEIRIAYGPQEVRSVKAISVTMRTPGNDEELATGFLLTEGIISSKKDLSAVAHCFIACAENKENVIQVELSENTVPRLPHTDRNFYTTSSCGVCGKGSIDAIRTVSSYQTDGNDMLVIDQQLLQDLPAILRKHQDIFDVTGGLHATALFDLDANLLLSREDVGRHNALDKLIGAALENEWLPLNQTILLLSGRASFELIQKAAMAGIKIVAAVGAPSSLAVELAAEFNITLVGFLRDGRFNVYTATHRILVNPDEYIINR